MEELPKIEDNREKSLSRSDAYKKIAEIAESKGMEFAVDRFFEAGNIEADFLAKQRDPNNFKEAREKLQSEPGVIIANHPGVIDIFFILKALGDRKDVKVFSTQRSKKQVYQLLGEEAVISLGDDNYEGQILEAIQNGEVVIFLPTGGSERMGERELEFKRGFGNIFVKNLDPDIMVYSFHINHKAIEDLIGVTIPPNTDQPNLKRKEFFKKVNLSLQGLNEEQAEESSKKVEVDERCTNISDWSENPEENTDKYLEMFNLNKKVDENN